MGILGELGAGKTLCLVYLTAKSYLLKRVCCNPDCREILTVADIQRYKRCKYCNGDQFKRLNIYSNFKLNGIPYTFIDDTDQLEDMRDGFFAADELWRWLNARVSSSKKNRFIGKILLKLRKYNVNLGYTSQAWRQTDVWIRGITDFLGFPKLQGMKNQVCFLYVFKSPPMQENYMKTYVFKTNQFSIFFTPPGFPSGNILHFFRLKLLKCFLLF